MRPLTRIESEVVSTRDNNRAAFTLIELLVVIGILLALAATTLVVWNSTADSDRVRSAARQLQSALLGARDRAIFAQKFVGDTNRPTARGLRLLRSRGALAVVEMTFVEANDPVEWTGAEPVPPFNAGNPIQSQNLAELLRFNVNGSSNPSYDPSDPIEILVEPSAETSTFTRLKALGLIQEGATRIQLNETPSTWRQFSFKERDLMTDLPSGQVRLIPDVAPAASGMRSFESTSTSQYLPDPPNPPNTPNPDYNRLRAYRNVEVKIEIRPTPIANEAVLRLPAGMGISLSIAEDADFDGVIDAGEDKNGNGVLDGQGSQFSLAGLFTPPDTTAPQEFDIMFSPRGTVTGPLAAQGLILFLIGSLEDIERGIDPRWVDATLLPAPVQTKLADNPARNNWVVLCIYPQTGYVVTSPLDLRDEFNNQTGASGADGYADDIFRFARAGETANR
jgi:prepilin-type N-terminal cleavage/methylation domain-containing protein